jgi:hypothetical protein
MKAQGLLENRRFVRAALLMLALLLAATVAKILAADRSQTYALIGDITSVLCGLIATVFYVRIWFSTGRRDASRKIWAQVAVGMLLWTAAEAIWGYYEVVLGEEVPYPSAADLFWLVGYLPLYLALLSRYRIFQTAPTRRQELLIGLFALLFSIGSFVFVLYPMLVSFDTHRLIESLLNIIYPLADLLLLILTLAIVFTLEEGRFSLTWRLFGLGLVLVALADLLFSYATWNELYFPEGRLTAITVVIDTLYYASYLTLGLGAYTFGLISNLLESIKINIVLRSLTKSNILVFIDAHGRIISLSNNFLNLVHATDKGPYLKMPLDQALGIDALVVANLIHETLAQGSISNRPAVVRDAMGSPRDVWLTLFAIHDAQHQQDSIALVLRTNLNQPGEIEMPLNADQSALADYYLSRAGTYDREENQVIKAYFLEQVNMLYSLVRQFSGVKVAEKLLVRLGELAGRNNWPIAISGQHISIPEEYEGQALVDLFSALLREAKSFASSMTDLKVVEQELKFLDQNLDAQALKYVDKYELRGGVTLQGTRLH